MKKLPFFLIVLILGCGQVSEQSAVQETVASIRNGHWLISLEIEGEKIPFNAFFSDKNDEHVFVVKNGDEVISVTDVIISNDSISFTMPVFGSRLKAHIDSDTSISGTWFNTTKSSDYQIPLKGLWGVEERFEIDNEVNPTNFSGKWEVTFSPDDEKPCKAIGVFEQDGSNLHGTFLTETGDYRYLDGKVSGNNMMLSCFDGAHAFLFKANLTEDQTLKGKFWSGNHWSEDWIAKRNSDYSLPHPDSIAFVVGEGDIMNMTFTDLQNKPFKLSMPELKNKVVILQILGTWCPNCADETRDFSRFYKQYRNKGLEIVAVAYERTDDFQQSKEKIELFKKELGADYTFLYAGKASKKKSSEDFKMINGVFSYPTAIFIDRKGKIRKIHSGYYGPGTGNFHHRFQEETEMFIEKLLAEDLNS